ncbi:MAG TPA: tRNA (adenosine(37)-N6)-dimethylallyltransferase MiaA [Candidatus Moranbacteria bacterium]|nr:tRNA (adenosine(37)-N6)-dimethylallyltransferase MiaA [Candidatus Moranbacteria bacterium]
MRSKNPRIIVILGPTSSGKSEIAIRLAKKFDGEIISADSRQIYRGMDVGTGKVPKSKIKNQKSKLQFKNKKFNPYWSNGVAHYLIDIVSPKTNYNAAKFKKDAYGALKFIINRGKIPIICGGTGFWIKSIVDNVAYPEVKPDWKLRNKLRNNSAEKLFKMLEKLDPKRVTNIDKNNKVRLIRAIEICKKLKHVPSLPPGEMSRSDREGENHNFLQIGIKLPKEKLHKNIKKRLKKRFEAGMIKEIKDLKKQGLSWKKIQSFGLGYFWIPLYLHPIKYAVKRRPPKAEFNMVKNKKELFDKIYQAEKDYAKRQMTWFGKDKRIKWIEKYKDIEKEAMSFLK